MADSSDKKKLVVRIELDLETNQWVASVQQPKRLVTEGHSQASGTDAGQARNRLVSKIEEFFPGDYEFEDALQPPPHLEEQVAEYAAALKQERELREWLRERRLPLALQLIQSRVPQNICAPMLGVTPTWLGHELKQHGTRPTGNTGKVTLGTGKVAAKGTAKIPTRVTKK